ncbi:MAG: YigZ family protein [Clostridiales bacterium]|nr:YigZ family protein [Clostridiales bacterium]
MSSAPGGLYHVLTLAGEGQSRIEDRHSVFFGYAFPCRSEEELKEKLKEVAGRHPKARHIVYAARFYPGTEKAHDAGEPAYTAGLPILEALRHEDLYDAAVIVARLFGGILLGKGGLIRAYGKAAREALAQAPKETRRWTVPLTLSVPYDLWPRLKEALSREGLSIEPPLFADKVTFTLWVPGDRKEDLRRFLTDIAKGDLQLEEGAGTLRPL